MEVSNVKELPEEYLKYKDPEPDKVKLKADLKAGVEIDGVCLITKENIQIK